MALIQILHPLACMMLSNLLSLSSVKWGNTNNAIGFCENTWDFIHIESFLSSDWHKINMQKMSEVIVSSLKKYCATLRILRQVRYMPSLVCVGHYNRFWGIVLGTNDHQHKRSKSCYLALYITYLLGNFTIIYTHHCPF